MATDTSQHFRDASEKVRTRAENAAKALGGIGSLAVTAIGLSKVGDVFPVPDDGLPAVGLLLGGLLSMAAAVAAFTFRLWGVNRPLVTRSDPDQITDVRESERKVIRAIFDREARHHGAPSLRALEARAHRLARIAERSGSERAKELEANAESVMASVLATHNRAALIVIRQRATDAISSWTAGCLYMVFVAGFLAFMLSADWLDNERAGGVGLAKSCADARAAGAVDLPRICGTATPTPSVSPEQEVSKGLEALFLARRRCMAAAGVEAPTTCAALSSAYAAAMK